MRPGFLQQVLGKIFSEAGNEENQSSKSPEARMIIGLGNPGAEYAGTRHNAGFEVVDALASQLGVEVKKKKFGGFFGQAELAGHKLLLLKPAGYMNRSGQAVATAVGFYKLDLNRIIVVTDDMALEPGRIRIRAKGSAGGHNGLTDIIARLGRQDFARMRIGIGRSQWKNDKDYVLSRPNAEEGKLIKMAIEQSRQGIICWVKQGIDTAMNRFNSAGESNE